MMSKTMTIVFQIETPIICLQITGVRSFSYALNGGPWITDGSGGSVDKANAANVSIIKLIHNSLAAEIGDSTSQILPKITVKMTEIFTVTWNWRNLPMFW